MVAAQPAVLVQARRGRASAAPTASDEPPAAARTAAIPRTHAAPLGDAESGRSSWGAEKGARLGSPILVAKLMPASQTATRPLGRAQRSDLIRSRGEAAGGPSAGGSHG